MKIEIHVPTSEQSLPYAQFLTRNFSDLSTGNNELEFHFHALDPDLVWKITGHHVHNVGHGRGSSGHAVAFQNAVNFPATNAEIRIIADTDTVMLERGWDQTLAYYLQTESMHHDPFDVIGTTYEPIGGFSSGDGSVQTYKGRPNATWIAFTARALSAFQGQSFAPAKQEHLLVANEELSKRYNLPVGNSVLRDIGWQIPEIIDRGNLRDFGLKHVKPTKGAKAILTGNDYHEEYQLRDGTPFVAHQRGSMKHPFRGNDISSTFYNAVESYLK